MSGEAEAPPPTEEEDPMAALNNMRQRMQGLAAAAEVANMQTALAASVKESLARIDAMPQPKALDAKDDDSDSEGAKERLAAAAADAAEAEAEPLRRLEQARTEAAAARAGLSSETVPLSINLTTGNQVEIIDEVMEWRRRVDQLEGKEEVLEDQDSEVLEWRRKIGVLSAPPGEVPDPVEIPRFEPIGLERSSVLPTASSAADTAVATVMAKLNKIRQQEVEEEEEARGHESAEASTRSVEADLEVEGWRAKIASLAQTTLQQPSSAVAGHLPLSESCVLPNTWGVADIAEDVMESVTRDPALWGQGEQKEPEALARILDAAKTLSEQPPPPKFACNQRSRPRPPPAPAPEHLHVGPVYHQRISAVEAPSAEKIAASARTLSAGRRPGRLSLAANKPQAGALVQRPSTHHQPRVSLAPLRQPRLNALKNGSAQHSAPNLAIEEIVGEMAETGEAAAEDPQRQEINELKELIRCQSMQLNSVSQQLHQVQTSFVNDPNSPVASSAISSRSGRHVVPASPTLTPDASLPHANDGVLVDGDDTDEGVRCCFVFRLSRYAKMNKDEPTYRM